MTQWDLIRAAHRYFKQITIVCFAMAILAALVTVWLPDARIGAVVFALLGAHASTAAVAQERFLTMQAQIDMLRQARGEEIV